MTSPAAASILYRDQRESHKAYRGFAPGHLYQLVPHRLFLDAQVAHVFKLWESSRKDITVIPGHYNIVAIKSTQSSSVRD